MAVVQLAHPTHRRQRRLQQRRTAQPPVLPTLVGGANFMEAAEGPARGGEVARSDPPRVDVEPVAHRPDATRALPPIAAQEAVLLELFGRQPVAFHRAFVDVTGSVTAALWLSHAIGLAQQADASAPFHLSQDDCSAATGLSRREQETARARLRGAGLVTEARHGRQIGYRIDFQELAARLLVVCERSYVQAVERAQLSGAATGTAGR